MNAVYNDPEKYFNSIKVRLKPFKTNLEEIMDLEFQFHKGTIKTIRTQR